MLPEISLSNRHVLSLYSSFWRLDRLTNDCFLVHVLLRAWYSKERTLFLASFPRLHDLCGLFLVYVLLEIRLSNRSWYLSC